MRARGAVLVAAAAFAYAGSPAWSQNHPSTTKFDGERLFQLYNSTATPRGYRRHLDSVFAKAQNRIAWSTPGKSSALVPMTAGGTASRGDGASVTVAPGSLPRDLVLSAGEPANPAEQAARQTAIASFGLQAVSNPVEFGPAGIVLSSAAVLAVPYDPGRVSGLGLDTRSVRAYAWDATASRWAPLDSEADPSKGIVTAKATRLSVVQAFGRKGWVPTRP